MDILIANVGNADVVADLAGGVVDTRIGETEFHLVREIDGGGETAGVGVRQVDLIGTEQVVRHLQLPAASSQRRQVEDGRVGRRIPDDGRRI